MVIETDLDLGEGRTLHVYDTGAGDLVVFWHHGTPNVGEPPEPLLPAAAERGIRWVSSPGGAVRRSCGCARRTGTSRSSSPGWRRWTGCWGTA